MNTRVSGKIIRKMDLENRCSHLIEVCMRGSGSMTNLMDKASILNQMETLFRDSGNSVKLMGPLFLRRIQMEKTLSFQMFMKENGKMAKNMDKGSNNGVMEPNFKACIRMTGNMEMVLSVSLMDLNIQESLKTG